MHYEKMEILRDIPTGLIGNLLFHQSNQIAFRYKTATFYEDRQPTRDNISMS